DKYPITMWNNLTNAGNTVGCELRAKVKTFWNVGGFAAERVISARTVVWTPPMGVGTLPADTTTLTSPLSGTPQIPYPGLSIAVGTEMTTSAALNRLRFPSGGFRGYDPTGLNNKFLQFSYDHAGPGSAGSMQSNTISDSIDRLEMAVACVNPATLARNSYLSAIVELASRNSHFRNYTELLHMNPQYRSVLTACSTPTGLNFPTLVAAAGSDIAQVTYQTPFVFYNGGVIQDPYTPPGLGIPPHFGVMTGEGTTLVNGFLNPFPAVAGAAPYGKPDGSGGYNGLTSQTIQYHALLASQLRYCNHLYDKDPLSSSTGGISRFDGLNLPLFYDSRFDPRALEFYYGVDLSGSSSNPIRTPEYLPGGCSSSNCPPWGQSCPWSNGTNYPFSYPTTGCALEGNVRSLKLSELVATLGTTQSCPYPIPHGLTYDSGIPSAWQTECFKPLMRGWPITGEFDTPPSCLSGTSQTQIGPNELRADIVATLAYLGGKTVDHLPGIGSGTAQALVPPGLFKISSADPSTPSWTGLQNAARVFDADRYVSERVSSTTIMLVLHQRLNTAATDSLGTVTAAGSGSSCDRPCSCGSGGSSGDNSEYCKIRCLVVGEGSNLSTVLYHSDPDTGVMRRRPIVIAYFPTNILDASAEAITNLQCAFNASRANTDLDVNFLHVFSPTTDLVFQAQAGNSNCATGSIESLTATQQDQCFQSYWTFILSPPAGAEDSSIVEEAKKDYRDRLVSPSILF
ncbi:MAG: hypothetical protein J0M12_17040, partial [Deltaproteobacteria bacterium]|nr:hypothetical protein [Deltaproteobacteria bacterium]